MDAQMGFIEDLVSCSSFCFCGLVFVCVSFGDFEIYFLSNLLVSSDQFLYDIEAREVRILVVFEKLKMFIVRA